MDTHPVDKRGNEFDNLEPGKHKYALRACGGGVGKKIDRKMYCGNTGGWKYPYPQHSLYMHSLSQMNMAKW